MAARSAPIKESAGRRWSGPTSLVHPLNYGSQPYSQRHGMSVSPNTQRASSG